MRKENPDREKTVCHRCHKKSVIKLIRTRKSYFFGKNSRGRLIPTKITELCTNDLCRHKSSYKIDESGKRKILN